MTESCSFSLIAEHWKHTTSIISFHRGYYKDLISSCFSILIALMFFSLKIFFIIDIDGNEHFFRISKKNECLIHYNKAFKTKECFKIELSSKRMQTCSTTTIYLRLCKFIHGWMVFFSSSFFFIFVEIISKSMTK